MTYKEELIKNIRDNNLSQHFTAEDRLILAKGINVKSQVLFEKYVSNIATLRLAKLAVSGDEHYYTSNEKERIDGVYYDIKRKFERMKGYFDLINSSNIPTSENVDKMADNLADLAAYAIKGIIMLEILGYQPVIKYKE